MGSVVHKVGMGKAFLPVLQFPISIIPPKLHTHSSIHHWLYITSTADSILKYNSRNVNSLSPSVCDRQLNTLHGYATFTARVISVQTSDCWGVHVFPAGVRKMAERPLVTHRRRGLCCHCSCCKSHPEDAGTQ